MSELEQQQNKWKKNRIRKKSIRKIYFDLLLDWTWKGVGWLLSVLLVTMLCDVVIY
jgi:hypothetical protein